jgi:hypothetical protein
MQPELNQGATGYQHFQKTLHTVMKLYWKMVQDKAKMLFPTSLQHYVTKVCYQDVLRPHVLFVQTRQHAFQEISPRAAIANINNSQLIGGKL